MSYTPESQRLIDSAIAERLEYLRDEIRAERISYSELAELQGLAEHIDSGDVELLEWAGVPEKMIMLSHCRDGRISTTGD